jgi:CBS domain-containing protein
VYLMTHSVILNFVLKTVEASGPIPFPLQQSLADMGLLRDKDILSPVKVCTNQTPFIEILRCFLSDNCSAVPLVEENSGRLVSVVLKSDLRGMVAPGVWRLLHEPVGQLLLIRYHGKSPDLSGRIIHPSESFETAMRKLAARDVYRLFIVDDSLRIVGKLTLSKLMQVLLRLQ